MSEIDENLTKKRPKTHGRPKNKPGQSRAGRVLEEHPLFDEIHDLLKHAWAPETVWRQIGHLYADELSSGRMKALPSSRTISRWRDDHMAPTGTFPERLLEKKLGGMEAKIDLFQSLQKMYVVAENRMAKSAEAEENLPFPHPGIDRAMDTVMKIADQLWRVGQDLGLFPRGIPLDTREVSASAKSIVFLVNGETQSLDVMTDSQVDAMESMIEGEIVRLRTEADD